MPVRLSTVVTTIPPRLSMQTVAEYLRDEPGGDVLANIVKLSGIATKGFAVHPIDEDPRSWSPGKRVERASAEVVNLAQQATATALEDADLDPGEVGMFGVSTSTTHVLPSLIRVAPKVGFRPDIHLMTYGPMGCCAGPALIESARCWTTLHQKPVVLVLADVFSAHLPAGPYDEKVAISFTLFGDGAAAVVLHPDTTQPGLEIIDAQPMVVHEQGHLVTGIMGDAGFEIVLERELPAALGEAVKEPVKRLLERNHLGDSEIGWWAIHPAGRSIITAVAASLNLPESSVAAARRMLRENGNTISAAMFTVLEHLHTTAPLAPGQYGVLLGYGPGLAAWSMLVRATT